MYIHIYVYIYIMAITCGVGAGFDVPGDQREDAAVVLVPGLEV